MSYVYDEGGVHVKNLANNAEKYGIGQYRFAHSFELLGKEFDITFNEKVMKLSIKSREKAELDGREFDCECLKLEKDTYFVRFGLSIAVLDLEQCLATLISGDNYVSGVISDPKPELPEGRHTSACGDMVGTKVRWILGSGRCVDHDYFAEGQVGVAWSPRDGRRDILPCQVTKIRGPVYLVDVTGGVPKDVCAPFFTNRVIMLQDYDHMIFVGCVFGTGFDPVMISGYASFLD